MKRRKSHGIIENDDISGDENPESSPLKLGNLSIKESQALILAAQGKTDQQAAIITEVSYDTLVTFWKRIRAKTFASNRMHVIQKFSPISSEELESNIKVYKFPNQEGKVVRLILQGHTDEEITKKVEISLYTLRTYIKRIKKRMEMRIKQPILSRYHIAGIMYGYPQPKPPDPPQLDASP